MEAIQFHNNEQVVKGRLYYNDLGEHIADVNRKIRVFLHGWFGSRTLLASGKTDERGKFKIKYPYSAEKQYTIIVEAVEKRQPFANDGFCIKSEEVALLKKSYTIPPNTTRHNLGSIERSDAEQPEDITKVNKPLATNTQDPEYFRRLVTARIPELVKSFVVKAGTLFGMNAEGVMRIYNSFGKEYHLREATIENLIDDLLNSVSAIDYVIDREENEIIWISDLEDYEFDRNDCLPEYCAVILDSETKKFKEIEIRFRDDPEEGVDIFDEESDPKQLEWAIRQAMAVFGLQGEAKIHLALGHILPGTCSTPFFKYIKEGNPLRDLLGPFIGQTQFINFTGSKGIIFGKGSVLEVSQLTEDGVAKMILEGMESRANYQTWRPREPINRDDIKAHDQNLFYSMLQDFFAEKIESEWNTIAEQWEQVYCFSKSIHKRYNHIPLITRQKTDPSVQDKIRLTQFVTYMAHLLSFHHWYAHSRQQRIASGDVIFVQTNRGLDAEGNYAPYGGADPSALSKQVSIARTLLAFDADTLLEKPVNRYMMELGQIFQEKIDNDEFLTLDIREVHSGTQI